MNGTAIQGRRSVQTNGRSWPRLLPPVSRNAVRISKSLGPYLPWRNEGGVYWSVLGRRAKTVE